MGVRVRFTGEFRFAGSFGSVEVNLILSLVKVSRFWISSNHREVHAQPTHPSLIMKIYSY